MPLIWSRFCRVIWAAIPFAILTGVALALAWWFGQQLNALSGAISLTILIVGFFAGAILVVYVVLRWRARVLLAELQQQAVGAISDLNDRMKAGQGPITRQDLAVAGDMFAGLWPKGLRLFGLVMTLGFVMAVTLQILALANAAVMYLQAKRLEDQNLLLAEQNRKLDYEFLREWSEVRETLVENLSMPGNLVASFESDLSSPMEIMREALRAIVGVSLDDSGRPELCEEPQACDGMTLGELRSMALTGSINVTDTNIRAIAAFRQLFRYAEGVSLVFISDAEDPLKHIEAVSERLKAGASSCGSLAGLSAEGLWNGLAHASYGALQAWPVDEFTPGQSISLPEPADRANFGIFSAGLGIAMQAMAYKGVPDQLTADEAGAVFAKAMYRLQSDVGTLVVDCKNFSVSTREAFRALSERNQSILDAIHAAQVAAPSPAGAATDEALERR